MQQDNAHLDLDEHGISSGVITPADDELDVGATSPDADGFAASDGDLAQDIDNLKVDIADDDDNDNANGEQDEESPAHHSKASEPRVSPATAVDSDNGSDDEYASRSDIEARLAGFTIRKEYTAPNTEHVDEAVPELPQEPKIGKAALKRAKKAAKQAEAEQSDTKQKCQGCDAAFQSKNQLHQHLQEHTKHAALKVGGGKRGKKR